MRTVRVIETSVVLLFPHGGRQPGRTGAMRRLKTACQMVQLLKSQEQARQLPVPVQGAFSDAANTHGPWRICGLVLVTHFAASTHLSTSGSTLTPALLENLARASLFSRASSTLLCNFGNPLENLVHCICWYPWAVSFWPEFASYLVNQLLKSPGYGF